MKKLFPIFTIFLIASLKLSAAPTDIDSLKEQLSIAIKSASSDSLKGPMYSQVAAQYMDYDTIRSKKTRWFYQNEALKNIYKAIHYYSKYNDTAGLALSFTSLSRIYHSQKKFTQAKWFIIQANTLARATNKVSDIISSLLEMAAIKSDIKDYSLAMRDLNEALQLSVNNHNPHAESAVQQSYVLLYNHLHNYAKADIALKRHDFIEDSIKRNEEAKLVAKINTSDSLQRKKKLYIASSKRLSKNSSSKRIASL